MARDRRSHKFVFALCIESSHARGMGHFYRALNLADALAKVGQRSIFYMNDHVPAIKILAERGLPHRILSPEDWMSNRIASIIRQDDITLWINDRHNTTLHHAETVKKRGIPLVTFDDRGPGAQLADLHIAALTFDVKEVLGGDKIIRGLDYLILNKQIEKNLRIRNSIEKILVTLGGSDTYGVTFRVVQLLKQMKRAATVVVGPAFKHFEKLKKEITEPFILKQAVPSMIDEFFQHDLAITGGGITPFEANASGLPCIVIANETFEVAVGKAVQSLGSSIYAGYHTEIQLPLFPEDLPIEQMSRAGMNNINLFGAQRVVDSLLETSR